MATKTRPNLKAAVDTAFADNTSGAITAASLRAQLADLADSALFSGEASPVLPAISQAAIEAGTSTTPGTVTAAALYGAILSITGTVVVAPVVIDSVVILGASIMNRAFGQNLTTPHAEATSDLAAAGTPNMPVYGYGFSGARIADTIPRIDTIFAARPNALVVIHIGGNNVTATRPYSSATPTEINEISADYDALFAKAAQYPGRVLIASITFRSYNDANMLSVPSSGSKPYNENILIPKIAANIPAAMSNERPRFDFYRHTLLNFENELEADGIHPDLLGRDTIRLFTASRLADYFNGVASTAIAERTATVVTPPPSTGLVKATVNFGTRRTGATVRNDVLLSDIGRGGAAGVAVALLNDDGSAANAQIAIKTATTATSDVGVNTSGGASVGVGTYAGNLLCDDVTTSSIFAAAPANAIIEINGLAAGATYNIKATGLRTAADARVTKLSQGTPSITYATSVNPPNVGSQNFTADGTGEITLLMAADGASPNAYIGGLQITPA